MMECVDTFDPHASTANYEFLNRTYDLDETTHPFISSSPLDVDPEEFSLSPIKQVSRVDLSDMNPSAGLSNMDFVGTHMQSMHPASTKCWTVPSSSPRQPLSMLCVRPRAPITPIVPGHTKVISSNSALRSLSSTPSTPWALPRVRPVDSIVPGRIKTISSTAGPRTPSVLSPFAGLIRTEKYGGDIRNTPAYRSGQMTRYSSVRSPAPTAPSCGDQSTPSTPWALPRVRPVDSIVPGRIKTISSTAGPRTPSVLSPFAGLIRTEKYGGDIRNTPAYRSGQITGYSSVRSPAPTAPSCGDQKVPSRCIRTGYPLTNQHSGSKFGFTRPLVSEEVQSACSRAATDVSSPRRGRRSMRKKVSFKPYQ
ncbi:unnamed protein product [Calicophoron daubneyi]|uniref:Uncharacterized protein n=1 Tax=Calicophoron daubneyi TaxID=300641 RepID=A0AAV2T1X1_CALDB